MDIRRDSCRADACIARLCSRNKEGDAGVAPTIACVLLLLASWAVAGDLTGTVVDEKNAFVAGAVVSVVGIAPKTGPAFGAGYYADWQKHGISDEQGKFAIEGVDEAMRFALCAAAEGKLPSRVNRNEVGKEIRIKLKELPPERKDANHQIHGRVTDPDGKPLAGVEVEPTGWENANGGHTWGRGEGYDFLTVTNEEGEFVITSKEAGVSRDVTITSKDYATMKADLQPPGDDVHEYTLSKGATTKGRVVKDGNGLANVAVQAVQSDRNSKHFIGTRVVKSAEDGSFTLEHLKPDEEYIIAGTSKSLPEDCYTTLMRSKTGGEGESADVGDIDVAQGKTVQGKIKLSDGKPVPAGSTVQLGFDGRWDSLSSKIDKDGSFKLVGVPAETVMLWLRLKGYKPSNQNESLDFLNANDLMGMVDDDINDLVILMEPGKPEFGGSGQGNWDALKTKRLHGVDEDQK